MTLPYCDVPKALYAWSCATDHARDGANTWWHLVHDTNDCGQRLIDLATAHRITRVYLYVGAMEWNWAGDFSKGTLPEEEAVADLSTRLRAAGIEPWALWYLNDDPDSLAHADRVPDLVSSITAFNSRYPAGAFAGLHGDQEPNDPDVYADYLAMNALGLEAASAAGLGWSAALKPLWVHAYTGPFYSEVMETLTEATLMDYSDDPRLIETQGETLLSGLDGTGRTAEIAVETGWADPTPHVSLSELVQTDPEGFYTLMADLDAGFSAHESYAGMTIHDYTQFFADLHDGVEPYDYTGAVETLCPAEEDTAVDTAGDTASESPKILAGGCACAVGPAAGEPAGGRVVAAVGALLALVAGRRRWAVS